MGWAKRAKEAEMEKEMFQVAITIQVSRLLPGPGGTVRSIGGLRAESVGEGPTQAAAYANAEENGSISDFIAGLKAVEVVSRFEGQ